MEVNQDAGVPKASGRLDSVRISNGGVPKKGVAGPVEITIRGVTGDRQRDLRYHGGPDRAVCLFSSDRIESLRSEGHPIDAGTTGENLTISGIDWDLIAPGARLGVGGVVLEITKPAHPCKTIAGSFVDGGFTRISAKQHPGWGRMYARVLKPGTVQAGDVVTLL